MFELIGLFIQTNQSFFRYRYPYSFIISWIKKLNLVFVAVRFITGYDSITGRLEFSIE